MTLTNGAVVTVGGTGVAVTVATGSTRVTGAVAVNPAGGDAILINTGGARHNRYHSWMDSDSNDSAEFAMIFTKHRSHVPAAQISTWIATLYPKINVNPSYALAPSQAMDLTFNTVLDHHGVAWYNKVIWYG